MALNIGGQAIDRLRPPNDKVIPKLASEAEVETRMGSDGHSTRPIGTRGKPVVWSTVTDLANAANGKTHREALLALQGTTVSTEDIWGDAETSVLVELVVEPFQRVVEIGGATKYRVECDVTLRKVAA